METENDADRDAKCNALQRELEAAKSLVASRDMLAAQWGLGMLLGEQTEFSNLRVAHDMLNARVRMALKELNDSIKALIRLTAPSQNENPLGPQTVPPPTAMPGP
eukprot:2444575-Prorocentrum_lima.AAC.1